MFVCLFVCLFVGIKPEKLYSASCWDGSKPPGSGHTRAEAQNRDVHTKDSGTHHVLVNLWLNLVETYLKRSELSASNAIYLTFFWITDSERNRINNLVITFEL